MYGRVDGLEKADCTATFRISGAWVRRGIDKHRVVFGVAAVYHAEKESCRSREELRGNGSRYSGQLREQRDEKTEIDRWVFVFCCFGDHFASRVLPNIGRVSL